MDSTLQYVSPFPHIFFFVFIGHSQAIHPWLSYHLHICIVYMTPLNPFRMVHVIHETLIIVMVWWCPIEAPEVKTKATHSLPHPETRWRAAACLHQGTCMSTKQPFAQCHFPGFHTFWAQRHQLQLGNNYQFGKFFLVIKKNFSGLFSRWVL